MRSLIVLGLLASGAVGAQSYDTNYGSGTFSHLSSGGYNSAFGYNSMFYNTMGDYNTAMGAWSLFENSTGDANTAIGMFAAYNTIVGNNTAIGMEALYGNQTGQNNIAIGEYAGGNAIAGNNNIVIGNSGLAKDNNVIRIGTQGAQKFTQIAGIYGVKLPAGGGQAVMVNSKGQLGIVSTVLHTSVEPLVTQADVLTLRQQIASLQNQINAMKAVK